MPNYRLIIAIAASSILGQHAQALTLRQDLAAIAPLRGCDCYSESYSEDDCSGVDPGVINRMSCDGSGRIVNPFAVNRDNHIPDNCKKFLYQKASEQNADLISNYLRSGASANARQTVEFGGAMFMLARNRVLNLPIVSASSNNPCGISDNVMTAARDISNILLSDHMQFGMAAIPTLADEMKTSEDVSKARAAGASAARIEMLERRHDAVIMEDGQTPAEREFCQALDPCKTLGGRMQGIPGAGSQQYCVVGGLILDTSCLNLPPSVRANVNRGLREARNTGSSCLRELGPNSATVADALTQHFDTPASNNIPRTHVCCGNSGCQLTTFGGITNSPARVRSIGGLTNGGNAQQGTITLSNSTLTSSSDKSRAGLIFHEFLHRLGVSNSCLHNHQDRTNHMRPNAQGQCYPEADGATSSLRFIVSNGECVPDPASPNAQCAARLTSTPINQYDPIYACQSTCFHPPPEGAKADVVQQFQNSRQTCRGFAASNSLSSTEDSTAIRGTLTAADGTTEEVNTCQLLERIAPATTTTAPAPASTGSAP